MISTASPPLAGLRVLDLSRVLAGPWCAQTLSDLGAEVIKVERPGVGDDTRAWGPPYARDADGAPTSESAYFLSANRGKRSVTIELAHPKGQAIVRRLAERADVVIENFKVGGLAKYGLDYASLAALNPRLIYCSITGFGQSGPYRDRPGYDFMIQALGGLMSVTGESPERPGGAPMKVGVALADVLSGLYATIGILAALNRRAVTGKGEHVDIALLDVQVAALANQALNYLTSGIAPGRLGNAHPNIVPYEAFQTKDGYVIVAVGNDGQFRSFCAVAGRPELAADGRFATNPERVRNRAVLIPIVQELIRAETTDGWLAKLTAAGVPCGPVNTLDAVFDDAQVKARGLRLDLPHTSAGTVPSVACPIRYAETPLAMTSGPPCLGEHTDAVLAELGLGADEIAALKAEGAV
ncbi:MAG: CaiB/BaiF CoA transferase family protein [Hyphomicrobium sp.]|uniref:CaiB/BaiF CoA transferase family protein n=1 Tax=Hyphomicrobium sp. TaxID=82 RepID=UPI003D13CC48